MRELDLTVNRTFRIKSQRGKIRYNGVTIMTKTFPVQRGSMALATLKGVEVGDKFFFRNVKGELLRRVCEKVTETQCVIGGAKYRIVDARAIGAADSYSFSRVTLLNYNEAQWNEAQEQRRLKRYRTEIAMLPWYDEVKISDDKIQMVVELLGSLLKK